MGLETGTQIGPFELQAELGRGAAGSVYRARHRALGRVVALKILTEPANRKRREEWLARLRREAEAAARLDHPHIVHVHALHEEASGKVMLLEMELVEGESLASHLERAGGALPPARALALIEKVARAAHHAHEHGIVHRDLKPSNVIIDERGEPRIVDFGTAKDLESAERLSVSGALIGTPSYFAPEQAKGDVAAVDGRTDTWALGVILYELLTGGLPFTGNSLLALIVQISALEPARPRLPDGSDAGRAGEVALSALKKDREARPSALAFAEACAKARRTSRRPRARYAAVLVVGVGLAGLVSTIFLATVERSAPAFVPTAAQKAEASLATRAAPHAAALARALDDPGRLTPCVTRLTQALATDGALRVPLGGVVLARSEDESVTRFADDRRGTPDHAAFAALLRVLDGAELDAAAREGLRSRRAAIATRLCERAREHLARAAPQDEAAGAPERGLAVDLLWRVTALDGELDAVTSRAITDLYYLSEKRLAVREGLEVHSLIYAFGECPQAFMRDVPFEDLRREAQDLLRTRPSLASLLTAGTACFAGARLRVTKVPLTQRAAALREERRQLAGEPSGWLAAFREGAAAPERAQDARVRAMRAVERLEWAFALKAGLVLDDPVAARDALIAAAEESVALGHASVDIPLLLLAGALIDRAPGLVAGGPERAWQDLEQAIEHAHAAATFHDDTRLERDRLLAQTQDDPAAAARVRAIVVSGLGSSLESPSLLVSPFRFEARARGLQRHLPGLLKVREPAEARVLHRRALEAGVGRVPTDAFLTLDLVGVVLETDDFEGALALLERLLAVDPRSPERARQAQAFTQAEAARDRLLQQFERSR